MSESKAALIGAGVVSFLPGLAQEQANKVKLALALAERATETARQEGLIDDWLAYYRNQLRFMGWDAVSPEQVHWPDERRVQRTDQALSTIAATAGERFAESTELSLQKLLAISDLTVDLEMRARERQHLQLLPCAPAGPNRVDMVLYHEVDTEEAFRAGFIGRKRSYSNVRAELVRFNILAFEHSHLPKVQRNVVEVSLRRIREYAL